MAKLPEIPEFPDAPSDLGLISVIWNYLAKEGSVIRAAPFSVAVAVAVITGALYYYLRSSIKDEYTSQIDDLKAANEKLDATSKSLQATIEYQDRKLASFTTSKLSEGDTHVSRLQYISVLRLAPYFPVNINVTFVNTGDLPSIGAQFFGNAIVSETKLSKDELDKYFSDLERAIKPSDSTLENQPKHVIFHTIVASNITIEMANTAMAGRAFLIYSQVRNTMMITRPQESIDSRKSA
jgi:hypothetical protein